MSWLGRHFQILASIAAAGVVFIGMGIAGLYQTKNSALAFIGAAFLLVGTLSSLDVGSVWPILANETSFVRLRAKSAGVGFFTNALGGLVFSIFVNFLFNADAANLGGKIDFAFAGFCAVAFVLSWLIIPETKSKTYEELDLLVEMKTKTRDFKKWMPISVTPEKEGNV